MIIAMNKDDYQQKKVLQDFITNVEKNQNNLDKEIILNPFINYLIYTKEKKVLAYLSYMDLSDRYEVVNLWVTTEERRKGIAAHLLEEMILLGSQGKIQNITLEVNKDNIGAIKLYEKYNFRKKAIRKGYYSGIDGILMEKEMN